MQLTCPDCQALIPEADVNARVDVAFCSACDSAHRPSAIASNPRDDGDASDVADAPAGCSVQQLGDSTLITASLRSLPAALKAVAVAVFANAIVGFFVNVAINTTARHFSDDPDSIGPVMEIGGEPLTPVMTIVFWLFLSIFIAFGLLTIAHALISCAGVCSVAIEDENARIRMRLGPITVGRQHHVQNIRGIEVGSRNNFLFRMFGADACIRVRADHGVHFGSLLTDEQQTWMISAIKKTLRGESASSLR